MKHFIDINNFKKTEIDEIIALAKKIKKNPKKYSSSCKNKTLGLIFEKQSLRTRLSFNVGMQKLGGSVLELQGKDIGFDNKREKAEDVLNVLSQYIDFLTLQENFKNYKNLIIVWIGDYNNVLRSLIHLQNIYDFKLNVVVPNQIFKNYKNEFIKFKNKNLKYLADPIAGVKKSNCIMTDVWVSMGEKNKNKEKYFKNFTVNKLSLIHI